MMAQSYSLKGQFWSSGLIRNDVPSDQSSFESTIGYIPTVSLFSELDKNRLIDMELSYLLDRLYSGDSLISNTENFYRYWIRYSNEKLEVRLGLQKIVFGPSQVLRSLSWFDTIDPEDPTGQTDGVEAFRLRWFPFNSLSLWFWGIKSEDDTLSFGGRGELSTHVGEWGLTYHQDPSQSIQMIGHSDIPVFGPHNRLAIDYRYDGFFGLWNESSMIRSNNLDINMVTIGADYTLPILSGILLMTETLYISTTPNLLTLPKTLTAFRVSIPIGPLHNFMLISTLDWDENNSYNYLFWSSTFDSFSINCMASINPQREESLQLMFIYNH